MDATTAAPDFKQRTERHAMNFDDFLSYKTTPRTPDEAAKYFAAQGFGVAAAFSTAPQYPAWLRAAAIVAMCKL